MRVRATMSHQGILALPPVKSGLLFAAPLRKDSKAVSFSGGKHLEDPTTETVDADGTFVHRKTGLVTDAAANTLRCERLGTLLEGERENLLQRVEEIDQAPWANLGGPIVTANTDDAPDGNTTADTIEDNSNAAAEARYQDIVVASDTATRTFSAFIKKTTGATTFPLMRMFYQNGAAIDVYAIINTNTGVITPVAGNVPDDQGIESIGDYWRAWIAQANNASGNVTLRSYLYPAASSDGTTWDATATGSAVFWGAQVEQATFPSSYIPTVAASVTRSSDQLAYDNAADIHCEPTDGTIILAVTPESVATGYPADAYLYDITDGTDGVSLFISQANDTYQFRVDSGGGAVANVQGPLGACRRGMTHVLATSWAVNQFRLYMNGIVVGQDIVGAAPTAMPNDIQIGNLAGGNEGFVNIAYVIIYDRVLNLEEIRRVTEWIQQQLGVLDLPPVMEGLNFYASLDQDETARSFWKGYMETNEPTTQTVDDEGSFEQRTTELVTPATANKLRIERTGALLEGTRLNGLQDARDFSQATWVATNMTVLTDSVVCPDGSTRTTNTIRADANNGTLIQDLGAIAIADRVFAIRIRRKAGTGNVQLTLDGGGGWTTVDVTSEWERFWIYQNVANPDIGIRLATSGDEVYIDFAQFEGGEFPSSDIPAGGDTRSADALTYDNTNDVHAEPAAGTVICAVTPEWIVGEYQTAHVVDTRDAGNNDGLEIYLENTDGTIHFRVRSGGGVVANMASSSLISRYLSQVVAGSWELNNFDIYVNGILENSDGAGAAPTAQDAIRVGDNITAATPVFANQQHLLIYNRVLTQPEILIVTRWILAKMPATDLPPITNGLTLMAPMTPGEEATSFVGGAHTETPTTETVDADGTFLDPTNYDADAGLSLITDATVNELRRELHGGLIEGARENLLQRSEEIDQAPWATAGGTINITPGTDIAPDGNNTADMVADADAAAIPFAYQNVAVPNDALTRVFAIYIKKTTSASSFPGILLRYQDGAVIEGAVTVNTDIGVLADRVGSPPDDSGIEDAGDYWRVWVAFANNTTGNTTCQPRILPAVNADGTGNWAVATIGSAVFWGAQLEQAAFPSSYIPTAGASVTRSEDRYIFDNTGDQHVEPADGTVVMAVEPNWEAGELATIYAYFVGTRDGGNNDGIALYLVNANGRCGFYVRSGGVAQASMIGTTVITRKSVCVASGTWAVNNFDLYVNGILEASDAAGAAPTAQDEINIGRNFVGGDNQFGDLSYLLTYIRVLDADENLLLNDWIRRRLEVYN